MSVGIDGMATPASLDALRDPNLAGEIFRLALEAFPDGMLMADDSGRILLVNGELERQFGYERNELLGKSVEILVPERLRARHAELRGNFGGAPFRRRLGTELELSGRRKDGTEFPLEIALNPIRCGGRIVVFAAVTDISERRRIERLKHDIVATVSHELRTPMASIAGSLGLLVGRWSGTMPETANRLLAIAHTNAQRLVRLADDLIESEKVEMMAAPALSLDRIDAVATVEHVIETNRLLADEFDVRVRLESDADRIEMTTDPDRLAQIVTNLLSNAVRFSPEGGEVVVTLRRRPCGLRIAIRDFGPGIPEEFKPRVFERFAQAAAADARRRGGAGLGLSIVKQLVLRLGGEVGFEDGAEGGTIFHVEIPDQGRRRPRILHLDDDESALAFVRTALRADADIVSAGSLETARAALASITIDLVILDIALGGVSGLDLLPHLRDAAGNNIPVIALSQVEGSGDDGRIRVRLPKARTSLDDLVATVRAHLLPHAAPYRKEVA